MVINLLNETMTEDLSIIRKFSLGNILAAFSVKLKNKTKLFFQRSTLRSTEINLSVKHCSLVGDGSKDRFLIQCALTQCALYIRESSRDLVGCESTLSNLIYGLLGLEWARGVL